MARLTSTRPSRRRGLGRGPSSSSPGVTATLVVQLRSVSNPDGIHRRGVIAPIGVVCEPIDRAGTRDGVPASTPSGGDHGRAGGLDKGCVRCPESDRTNRCPCPRTGDLDGDGHQARRGGPQRVRRGAGAALVLRVAASTRVRGRSWRRDANCPGRGRLPAGSRGPSGESSASPVPRGAVGAAARRVWCRRREDPGTRHRSTATGSGCTSRSADNATSCAVRQQGVTPCSFTSWWWWPSGHGGEPDGHRATGWPTPVLVSRGRPGVPPARPDV